MRPCAGQYMNRHILQTLIIISLGVLIYSNSFNVPFQFDDTSSIVENDRIKDLGNFIYPEKTRNYSLVGIPKLRYIGYLTFGINYKLHGLDVTGYHIVNVCIHIMNALLVYYLVLLTFQTPVFRRGCRASFSGESNGERFVAFFSALLFVSHPLQTQAVTYIVQRLASLATMFYLLSLVMYVRSRLAAGGGPGKGAWGSRLCYIISLISAVLAMKTKSISFTLPLMVTLYEFIFFRERISKRLLYLVPVLLTMLIIPLSLIDLDMGKQTVGEVITDVSEATRVESTLSRKDYLFTQFRVIMTYIRLMIFPVHQNLLYDYPKFHTFFNRQVFPSFLCLAAILSAAVCCLYVLREKNKASLSGALNCAQSGMQGLRLVSFGILWFFITLSVESGFIPIADVIFEHRVYLPSIGAFIAFVACVFILMDRFRDRSPHLKNIVIGVLVIVIVIFSGAAYSRNTVWQDSISLWKDVVSKSPDHVIGLNNLGDAYIDKGEFDKAIKYLKKAVAVSPGYAKAWYNLGFAYSRKGRFDDAVYYFKKAAAIKRDYDKAYNNLGNIFLMKNNLDMAAEYYQKAIKAQPRQAIAHYNLGIVFMKKSEIENAIDHFKKAIEINPRYAEAFYNLGLAYFIRGWTDRAIEQFETATELKPDFANAHYNLGVAYRQKGLLHKAEEQFRKARLSEKK